MKEKTQPNFEIRIYIGSVNEETKREFAYEELVKTIQTFQTESFSDKKEIIPVRVSRTEFISGVNYREQGWEIGIFNFPRKPKDINQLVKFAKGLGTYLLAEFQQNRICVVTPQTTIMLEDENASFRD